MRFAALLGLSTAASSLMIEPGFPKDASGPVYGGRLKVAALLQKVAHPSLISRVSQSQYLRQVVEYLTFTDENNITHPFLLEEWEASEDLKTWDLYLKKGIFFNNGDLFNADDVIFAFDQWLNPDINSPMRAILGDYLEPSGVEKIDPYQVRLHLKRPEIALPEHLFHFSAVILNHRTFEGDFLTVPHGTGPFMLEAFDEHARCLLKKRYNYWQPGLPFFQEIEFLDLGYRMSPRIAALKSEKIDLIDLSDMDRLKAYDALKGHPNIRLTPVTTARTNVLRMRVDKKPWTDNCVRKALKLCQHREKIRYLAYMDQGTLGCDFHVCPTHPEYCEKKNVKFDPRRAGILLKEAGYPDGVDVHLTIGDGHEGIRRFAAILQKDAARAGFRIHIQEIPNQEYMQKKTFFDFGITPYDHRPLGTMALKMDYHVDDNGNPGPWNETRWVDEEFSKLLNQADQTLDPVQRRKLFCKLEDIQMNRGSIGIACWQNNWIASLKRVKNIQPHPDSYLVLHNVWMTET